MRNGLSTSEAGKLGAIKAAETASIRKQNRIDDWDVNPKLCKFCQLPISYESRRNDFCNHSCAAAFNNNGVRRHGLAPINCLNCNLTTYNQKYCTTQCQQDHYWKQTKEKLLSTGIDESPENRAAKRYLIENFGGKCQICSLSEWTGQPMPLVLDHIDGNAYNNSISNLRVICNNCDSLLPTFKSRNKGNGRIARAKRYQIEKEILKDKPNQSV